MDIITESQKLVEVLSRYNESSISSKILDAINYSSTGTEMLMKLRFYLNELLDINSFNSPEISELAKKILIEINTCLN